MIDEKTLAQWQAHLASPEHEHDERRGHSAICPVEFKPLFETIKALWKENAALRKVAGK